MLQGSRTDHQNPFRFSVRSQPGRGGDRLQRLAEAHIVRQQSPTIGRQKRRTLNLIGVKAGAYAGQVTAGGLDLLADLPGAVHPGGRRCKLLRMANGVFPHVDVVVVGNLF